MRSTPTDTRYLFRPGQPPLLHRKRVPTHGERLIWGRSDGATFARATMHHAGEAVHVPAWPTMRPMYRLASQHDAFEARCFVLAAGTVQHRADLLDGLDRVGGDRAARDLLLGIADTQLQMGASCSSAPDGTILAETGADPDLPIAELDLAAIGRGLASLDTDGHYARPDVFELRVDRCARLGVTDAADGFAAV